jgi:hypothetical protein
LSEDINRVALEVAGPNAPYEIKDLAHRVAEADVAVRRVRYARFAALRDVIKDPHYNSAKGHKVKMKLVSLLLTLEEETPVAWDLLGTCSGTLQSN